MNNRISRLYDSKFDGDINEEMFGVKESEYKGQLIEIKSRIDSVQTINSDVYEYGYKTFELSNKLYRQYGKSNYEDKARILKFIASNYTFNNVSLSATYRKPFSFIAEGLSCPSWHARQDSNLQPLDSKSTTLSN